MFSFAHAKVLENFIEGFLGGDLTASDFGKNIKGLAEIFGKEVAAESLLQAIDDTLDAVVRTKQSIVMTGVGDDDIRVGCFGGCI